MGLSGSVAYHVFLLRTTLRSLFRLLAKHLLVDLGASAALVISAGCDLDWAPGAAVNRRAPPARAALDGIYDMLRILAMASCPPRWSVKCGSAGAVCGVPAGVPCGAAAEPFGVSDST